MRRSRPPGRPLRQSSRPDRFRALVALCVAAALTLVGVSGCGGAKRPEAGTATVLMLTAPDYLDPQLAYGTESGEADWITYTPLLTYKHASAPDGADLIPGLAESLPQVSPNGRIYTLRLRPRLVYSNGRPVMASDFTYAVERAIRLGWGGSAFLTKYIVGAKPYANGDASSISGIQADDVSGGITILLRKQFSAFANVLAFPATAPIPTGTPMRNMTDHPPPGVGAYEIRDVARNGSFNLVRNPRFEALNLPGIPTGNLARIVVRVESNPNAAIQQVLSNRADNLDPGTQAPPAVLARFKSEAPARFGSAPIPSTLYFFLNTTTPPFDGELARRAVVTALNRPALARRGGGLVDPGCYLLPPGIAGHPSDSCPHGDATADGKLAAGRQLVQESGTAGQSVTVWGEQSAPGRAYVRYYTRLLNRLGYHAQANLIPPSNYFRTVGAAATNPQTGFADWFNDFPTPSDFYRVMDADSIRPTHSANLGRVSDPFVQQQLEKLNLVPVQDLASTTNGWHDLDEYVATKAYAAVFGYQELPVLLSDRIDPGSVNLNPLFLSDWSSWSLDG